jgi:hypothetical protein
VFHHLQPALKKPVCSLPAVRPKLADLDDDGQALLSQVIDHYHSRLLDSPEAQAWLVSRGLNHPELVSHFKLGFAGHHGVGGSAGLLPSPARASGCVRNWPGWRNGKIEGKQTDITN